jgi:hypothetical protein
MYREKRRGDTKPHIFATSDIAFHDMLEMRENQSILITSVPITCRLQTAVLLMTEENQARAKQKTPKRLSSI